METNDLLSRIALATKSVRALKAVLEDAKDALKECPQYMRVQDLKESLKLETMTLDGLLSESIEATQPMLFRMSVHANEA